MIRFIILVFCLAIIFPVTAQAACSSPTWQGGDIVYNEIERVLQWCDGEVWHAAGQVGPGGPNDGCDGPAGVGGDIIYNADHHLLQYCDGDHWRGIGGGVDMTPAGFMFTDLTDQTQSTLVVSNIVNITGIGVPTDVTISGDGAPEFRINGGAWGTTGTIDDGDTLQLRLTTNAAFATTNTATVVVGTVAGTWGASTIGADTTPNAFNFTDQTDVVVSTLTSSNTVTITGINGATPVSVSGGGSPQIRINGGAWETSGNINNGQTLQVRLTSSASNSTMLSATVDVGGVTNQWDVTTVSAGGQQVFTSNGTFVVPSGVTSISAVCVGKGGAGAAGGNRGGDLRYITSLAVTPGESLTIQVGGTSGTRIRRSTTDLLVAANGNTHNTSQGTSSTIGGTIGGGNGGNGYGTGEVGAGGAGGYSGNGGAGGISSGSNGSGGGGGGGARHSAVFGGGGGGVGLLGAGSSGAGATGGSDSGGKAGSGGANGNSLIAGGNYGGGAAYDNDLGIGTPGSGAVRIIWGTGRAYPSTNTGDM